MIEDVQNHTSDKAMVTMALLTQSTGLISIFEFEIGADFVSINPRYNLLSKSTKFDTPVFECPNLITILIKHSYLL